MERVSNSFPHEQRTCAGPYSGCMSAFMGSILPGPHRRAGPGPRGPPWRGANGRAQGARGPLRHAVRHNPRVAYDEGLAERIRDALALREGVSERKMFGGIAFMISGNMACGVVGEDLMIRLDPEEAERALAEENTRPMDFTGRPMKGFVYVSPAATGGEEDLAGWVELAADHAASLPPK